MSSKPRSDNKLAALPPAQKAQLRAWLIDENRAYDEVVPLVREHFGVRTSTGALSKFYRTHCWSLRSSQAREFAEQVEGELRSQGAAKFDEATIALVRQKAFERAYARDGSIDELAILAKILADSSKLELKRQELGLTERRVKLLEEKARQADAAKTVLQDGTLSEAERSARMKAIFSL